MKKIITLLIACLSSGMSLANHWTPEGTNYSGVMSVYGVIQINGIEQYSNQLEVGAFCGDECRGSAIASEFYLTHRYLAIMTVYGEIGHQLTFKLYDHNTGQEFEQVSQETITFTEDGYGNPIEPYILNFTVAATSFHFITAGYWSQAFNWSGGVLPGANNEVFIDAPCQLDMNATVNALTVSNGQSLTVQSGKTLNVSGVLTNTSTTGLVIEDGAQLVHASENVSAVVKKNVTGYGTDNGNFILVSNPLTSAVNPELASLYHLTMGNYDLYDWLPNSPDNLNWRNYKEDTFMMLPESYGYLYASQNGVELNFPGTLKSSHYRFSKTVSYDYNDSEHPGWNLIGNPFVCNAYLVNSDNELLPFYRINTLGDGLDAVTSGVIAPMEGVFYHASGNETVYFIRTDFTSQIPDYMISVSANSAEVGSVAGGGTYQQGQSCTVMAAPATGYNFLHWTENGNQVSTSANYVFTVTGNRTLVAHFQAQTPNTYTVNVSANPSVGGTVTGGGTYNQGASCTVTAAASTGYTFLRWVENGTQVSTNANYTFTVAGNRTLVAQFQAQGYTISVSANPTNGGTVSGGGSYNYGQSCTVTATPADGYIFANWTENGNVVQGAGASHTFTITDNRTLVANFSYNTNNYIDLGLPSGTLWANLNVGASSWLEVGTRFAWGETASKTSYNWNTYQYCNNGDYHHLTKYCTNSNYGITDDLTTLLSEDDAATANWGTGWRTPTQEEWQELFNNTTHRYTKINNTTYCIVFTAANGNNLFLPVTGYMDENGYNGVNTCNYWSSSLYTNQPYEAWFFGASSNSFNISRRSRNCGLSVRAVRSMSQNNVPIGAIDSKFTINENGDNVYFSRGNLQYQAVTQTWQFAENQWDVIGISQGNNSQSTTRDLFGWGTSGWNCGNTYYCPWDTDNSNTNLYGPPGSYNLTGTYVNSDWGYYNQIDNGGNTTHQWRTLTHDEWVYILYTRSGICYAKGQITGTSNGTVNGVILFPDNWNTNTYNPNNYNQDDASYISNIIPMNQWIALEADGAVFLPAAGSRNGTSVNNVDIIGSYWTSTCYLSHHAYGVAFSDTSISANGTSRRYYGESVRLVYPAE